MSDTDNICVFLNGTYSNPATVATPSSCTTRCYIQAETDGAVIFNKTSGDAFSLTADNNWTIQGIVVNNSGSGKGYVIAGGSGIRLTNVSYYPAYNVIAGEGIYGTGVTDIIVTGYTARHDVVCNNQASAPCQGSGGPDDCDFWNDGGALINIGDASTDVIVQDSTIGYYRNVGIFRNITNLTMRRNNFSNCVNHGCGEIDDANGVLVENNIVSMDRNGACSDSYNGGDFLDTYCWKDAIVRNNTIVGHDAGYVYAVQHFRTPRSQCDDGIAPENMDPVGSAQYMNEKVYNNIIYDFGTSGNGTYPKASPFFAVFLQQGDRFDTSPPSQYYEDYNIVSSMASDKIGYYNDAASVSGWTAWKATNFDGFTPEANGKTSDPLFVTYTDGGLFGANDNLRLQSGSPAIDAGISTGSYPCPSDDKTGASRTGTCDIGAYNYGTTVSPSALRATTLRGATIR